MRKVTGEENSIFPPNLIYLFIHLLRSLYQLIEEEPCSLKAHNNSNFANDAQFEIHGLEQ